MQSQRNRFILASIVPALHHQKLVLILVFLSCFLATTFAQKIEKHPIIALTFKSGDRISGKLISISDETVELETVYAGRFTVRIVETTHWSVDDPALCNELAQFFPGVPPPAHLLQTNPNNPTAIKSSQVVSVDQIKAKNQQAKGAATAQQAEAWKKQVNFAYTMTRGNVQSSDVNLAFNIARKKGSKKTSFNAFGRSGVKNGSTSANLFTSTFRYEQTVLKLPFFTETQFEVDKLKKLDARISENLGLTYPMLKGESSQLSVDLGTGITREDYETGVRRLNGTSLLRLSASQKLANKSHLQQKATFFSDLSEPGSYRIQAEASLTTPLSKNLALRLAGINRYDAKPQGQVKPNDFTLLTGFTFEF